MTAISQEVPSALPVRVAALNVHAQRRLIVSVTVTMAIWALESIVTVLNSPEGVVVWPRLVVRAVEVPTVMICLTLAYRSAAQRRLPPIATLATSSVIGGILGVIFGIVMFEVLRRVPMTRGPHGNPPMFGNLALYGLVRGQIECGIWALAFIFPFAAEDARLRALETERLRTSAELERLRGQLEPHFLLNTLNAIAGLVTEDPAQARRLIACLGDLLRDAIATNGELHTVADEMTWLQRYTAILEARHEGALSFSWNVAPEAERMQLPKILLQPLVENAVKHGALRRKGDGEGHVTVGAEVRDAALVLTVMDNGPGLSGRPPRKGSKGLALVQSRLALGPHGGTFAISSETGSTVARVVLPQEDPRG